MNLLLFFKAENGFYFGIDSRPRGTFAVPSRPILLRPSSTALVSSALLTRLLAFRRREMRMLMLRVGRLGCGRICHFFFCFFFLRIQYLHRLDFFEVRAGDGMYVIGSVGS